MAAEALAVSQPKWMKNSDLLIAIGVLCVVLMMIVPLPPFILDLFLSANLMLSILVLLMVMYTIKAIEFSSFPSLLLVLTVFRLSLNVSTTRMILLGRGEEIGIIKAFGEFVVGGNFVVGIVIFLVLIMIQMLVIVSGTTRISEVAARFTLDAMPGKQMAIDADLNNGVITEKEAIEKRAEIRQEADFYGAMDGACKFVSGDVRAGLVITFINIIGGLAIGVWMLKLEPLAAAKSYTLLTIGDGLVSQIPALLISVATGLIVSRAASKSNLGADFTRELTANPKALGIASAALASLGIFTPLPTLPLVLLAAGTGTLSWIMKKGTSAEEAEAREAEEKEKAEKGKKPADVVSLLTIDPMELEIGYSLIPLVDPEQGGDLLDRVTMIRRQTALEMGLIVPPIRIRDNMQLTPNTYSIKIKGVEVARGEIMVDNYLAMNPGTATEKLDGRPTKDPTFGLPAIWITEENRERAEMLGYTVVDLPSVVATHLTEVIKRNSSEILGRQETQELLDNLKKSYPAIVEELVPNVLSLGEVQNVLHRLLREGLSIRDLLTILETLADYARANKDTDFLTERVRAALKRQICNQFQENGMMQVITLDPKIEEVVANSITQEGMMIDPGVANKLLTATTNEMSKQLAKGKQPVMLTSPKIRRYFKELTRRALPNLAVLSFDEIVDDVQIQSVGVVRI